jgi:outer membrane protein assembly factor BamB
MRWIALLVVGAALRAEPADWPRFRGPNAAGVNDEAALPAALDPANALWQTELPPGSSSPALAGDRIFLTAYEGDELLTFALNRASGKVEWRRALRRGREEQRHNLNNAASATPATDGQNVYSFFGDFGVISYGPDGEERWRMPLGPFQNLHGMASSPMLVGRRLFLLVDQDVDSYLLALDKDTGEVEWKTPRPEVVHGFSTPTLFEPEGDAPQLIVPGSYQLISYDLETGKKLWWVTGVTWQVKTAAVVDSRRVYMSAWAPGADAGARRFFPPFPEVAKIGDADGNGKLGPEEIPQAMRHTGSWRAIDLDQDGYMDAREWGFYRARWSSRNVTLAVEPKGARGDLTETHVAWDNERSVPVVSSPLLYRGALLLIKDGGILTVFHSESGEVIRQARLRDAVDKYFASPVAGDGKVYLMSETGKAVVLDAETWEPLSVREVGEPCYATPAIANGRIYVRTQGKLIAFGAAGP